jgi:hypothetical protein
VATGILIFNALALLLLVMILAVVLAVRLLTGLAVPGWATYTTGLIIVVFTQLVALSFNLVFSLVTSRSRTTFVAVRDYAIYVVDLENNSECPRARGRMRDLRRFGYHIRARGWISCPRKAGRNTGQDISILASMTMFWRSAPSWELRRSCSRKPVRDRGIALSQTRS